MGLLLYKGRTMTTVATITLPNSRWQLIGGLPVLADGDCCVVAWNAQWSGRGDGHCCLYESGRRIDSKLTVHDPFSEKHFATAEKLLDDYLAKKREASVKEVFRSEYVTVFRRDDGHEAIVLWSTAHDEWYFKSTLRLSWVWNHFRDKAEADAKRSLMEGK